MGLGGFTLYIADNLMDSSIVKINLRLAYSIGAMILCPCLEVTPHIRSIHPYVKIDLDIT